jgi:hypothetical protein
MESVHPMPSSARKSTSAAASGTDRAAIRFLSNPTAVITAMSLINLVLILIVIGVLLWLVNNYIPMDGKIKQIINVVVVIAVVVWLIQVFIGPLPDLRVGG